MKIVTVVGARPQFVKAFAVSRELQDEHEEVLVHTGQHYDEELSGVFFEELGIPEPQYNLGVGSGSHGEQTAAMLEGIESVVDEENPDVVLLYGDTNSTLAGAIAAAKLDPVVAHVEAGLRSYNREMPEEVNRVLTDHAADLLFPPSESAAETLAEEGVTDGVHVVGDVMYDAILWAREVARTESDVLDRVGVTDGSYTLATVHRAGNTDDRENLEAVFEGLAGADARVVLPVHPRTEERLREYDMWEWANEEIDIIEPVGYLDFVRLLDGATCVATDSGGVQKEAFFLETPVITLREETEWIETLENGWNRLVGKDTGRITELIDSEIETGERTNPYGDGNAAGKVEGILTRFKRE